MRYGVHYVVVHIAATAWMGVADHNDAFVRT